MRELRQFVEVASRRSISVAARHLNISQSALSRAMQKLEESYGAPLFVRTGGGMELSPYGSALYSRAVKIIPALDEAREEIEQLQCRAKAAIRVGTGDLWGLVMLPPMIRQFAQTHPDVVVHVEIADEGTRLEGLRNGTYDIVFGTLSTRYGAVLDIEFEAMTRQATYVYCDRAHPLAGHGVVQVDDLLHHRWISPGSDDTAGPGPLARQQRDFAVRVDTVMNALLLLRESPFLMSASSGFRTLFKQFGITAVDIEDPGPGIESGAIYPVRSADRAIVREFLHLARERARSLALPSWPAAEGS
jgi:DNA-binding transcriptional LysR family regulator